MFKKKKKKQSGLERLQEEEDLRSSCPACNTTAEHLMLTTTLAGKAGTHTEGKNTKKKQECKWENVVTLCLSNCNTHLS